MIQETLLNLQTECLWQFQTLTSTGSKIVPYDDVTDERLVTALNMYLTTAQPFECNWIIEVNCIVEHSQRILNLSNNWPRKENQRSLNLKSTESLTIDIWTDRRTLESAADARTRKTGSSGLGTLDFQSSCNAHDNEVALEIIKQKKPINNPHSTLLVTNRKLNRWIN